MPTGDKIGRDEIAFLDARGFIGKLATKTQNKTRIQMDERYRPRLSA